jgi:regulator of cell morphogenesis and NO signaling
MPTSTQSIREIVATQPSAARIFERFDIDLCLQAENSLTRACAELQLSVDQVLDKLADAEAQESGGSPIDPSTLSIERLIQLIVRAHHHYIRRELPGLAEMAQKLAAKHSDRAPELIHVAELVEHLRADLLAHIGKEEQVLFPFIVQMDQDSIIAYPPAHACFRSVSHPIFMMMQEHETANLLIAELRNITTGFEVPEWACATHTGLFTGLRSFEKDLKQHLHLENDLLFPRAINLEAELKSRG